MAAAAVTPDAFMMEAFPPLPPSSHYHHPPPQQQQQHHDTQQQQSLSSSSSHTRQPSFAERKQQEKGHQRRGSSPEKGQSRFLEGSMNDRVSAVPPPEFITGNKTEEEIQAWERQFYGGGGTRRSRGVTTMSTPASPTMGGFIGYPLGRPRSSLQIWGSGERTTATAAATTTAATQVTQKKSSGFLAPLWDGVREKLRGSRSSGSMEGVMTMQQGNGGIVERAKLTKVDHSSKSQLSRPASPTKPPPPSIITGAANGTSYPSREEVLESYKSLQASGFFNAHAIKGTRHPLRNAASAPMTGYTAPPPPIAVTGTMSPTPSGPSSPTSLYVPGDRRSFADRLAAVNSEQQLRPAPSISSFHQAPPPPPPKSEGSNDTSPSRGTKRPSQDIHGEQETATRKLVKKLRRSNSRTSTKTNFTTATTGHISSNHYSNHKSRPSTSSAMSGFSLFGGASLYTTTSTIMDPEQQTPTAQSPSKSSKLRAKMSFSNLVTAKLTKDKKEKKERISFLEGLRRKTKGLKMTLPVPVEQTPVHGQGEDVDMGMDIPVQVAQSMVHYSNDNDDDDDEMMLDAPYITPHPTHYHVSNPHPQHGFVHHHQRGHSVPLATLKESTPSRRNITPPTSKFYTSHGHQMRIRRSLEMELDENEGVVPRVPKVPMTYYTGKAVVVDVEGERRARRRESSSLQGLMVGKRERQQRDSGMSGGGSSSGGGGGGRESRGMGGMGGGGEVYVCPSQSGW
ncbi:hypothetical protein QBC40DRAFT_319367 [Triangularia verruculosa]|uniref:Uncharacterized protein n=1 Tax=Triangularia verruculosa TaxID=2587418 RepID=A0AAN6XAZ3_9PEZI|nr:hypothetical protein QBC40DRAFT_319367 [Triangularia verruculosa]